LDTGSVTATSAGRPSEDQANQSFCYGPAMSEPSGGDATVAIRVAVTIGETFADRYVVEKLLGRGGMGAVYRVRDRAVDEVIALKLLDLAAATPDAVERFRREVRLARRVTHRNAARTYDLGEWQGFRYLTMEYVDGESLRELTGRIRPSAARVIDFATQIARGLAAVHEAGVVHRDLKPANVLVERGGRVVITDFGIARGVQASDSTMHTGSLLGTPAYMSPEQIGGEPVDARSDLYSLGLMVFELLTSKLPFSGDTPMAMAMARLHRPLPDLRADSMIPASLAPVLERLLAREVGDRPAGANEVVELLDQALREFADHDTGTLGMAPATLHAPRPTSAAGTTSTTSSASRTPTSMPARGKALAVLPFRYRGPESERYVAETLSDELVDVLSTMKGLRVSGSGATARFAAEGDRDPRTIGSELDVDAIVDGTVQLSGTKIRIAARLLDVESGFQLWSERYDGSLEDVFELQDKMGRRIAEALRLKLEIIAHRGDAPAEAIETYMKARALARNWEHKGPNGSVATYQACLAIAPEFKPALAGLAMATMRAWFSPTVEPGEPDWPVVAHEAVAQALEGAAELAETHLAAATLGVHTGRYRDAATSLRAALRLAPTYAAAHEYLGRLQIEAGRPEDGARHLELAFELDPTLVGVLPDLARFRALRGDLEGCTRELQRFFAAAHRRNDVPGLMVEVRVAAWLGQHDQLQRTLVKLRESTGLASVLSRFAGMWMDRDATPEKLAASLDSAREVVRNPRFLSLFLQIGAEIAGHHGFEDLALRCVSEAANGVLVDLDWMDRCPPLAGLRSRPEWHDVRQLVRARAEAVWTV
jgi:serine/threonine protein kinase/tetratricopeptide (TPR) repeat protein